ncbi:Monooxygenase 2 [Glycine soja]|uniref:Monooxygenase 2 n=1 Tax=Glycine soja TaxID=3848 RepID=A0A445IU76_GLYSO|nr:Monooxygenase 2 [Glycine soja]
MYQFEFKTNLSDYIIAMLGVFLVLLCWVFFWCDAEETVKFVVLKESYCWKLLPTSFQVAPSDTCQRLLPLWNLASTRYSIWLMGQPSKTREIFSQGLCRGSEQSQVRTQVPCDGKAVYWFFAWTPNSQDKELEDNPTKLKEYVLNTLEKMPSDVRYYIEKIKLDVFLLAPLGYRHPWELMFGNISKGNACVGGDAFHPMTPDLGQGGCCALEDGVVLSGCLAEAFSKPSTHIKENDKEANQYRRIEESLKKYANERRWRSIDVNATTYMVGYIQ